MKKVILAAIVIGVLAVSCGGGGGNIKKVQKGVFSNYDNTITVGKAIENNSILKGGKWKAIEMEGRDYVTYTVRMTGNQVRALLPESLSSTESYRNKPHYGSAVSFYYNLSYWRRYNGYERTSMSAEEIEQAYNIFNAELVAYEKGPQSNDIKPMLTIDGFEITLSFVMNQDGTFTTNMMETYAEITLNCFNNLKVRYNVGNLKNSQTILNYIYLGFTPAFLWQR